MGNEDAVNPINADGLGQAIDTSVLFQNAVPAHMQACHCAYQPGRPMGPPSDG